MSTSESGLTLGQRLEIRERRLQQLAALRARVRAIEAVYDRQKHQLGRLEQSIAEDALSSSAHHGTHQVVVAVTGGFVSLAVEKTWNPTRYILKKVTEVEVRP